MHNQNLITTWQEDKIGNLLLKSKRQKKVKRSEYLDGGLYPIIDQGDNLIGGYTNDETYLFDGDLPMTIFGDHTRRFKYINFPFAIGADGTQLLVPKKEIDRRFFYYALKNAPLKNYGYQRHFKYLKDTKISFPAERKTQEEIVHVLGSYDDLIENSTKRIKILEEIAQVIYREWFVYFRFPGHEKVRMIDSKTELGKIPEGWAVKNLGDKINIFRGKNITKNTIVEGKIPVVAGGLGPAYFHNKANAEGPVITVSASGANAGYVNLYHEDIWASDCSYINKSSTPFVYYYYLLLKDRQIEVTGLQRGSAQPHVYPKDLARLSIVDASEELTRAFEEKANSLFGVINNLQVRNQKLRQARDLLLPKLVTGEIKV